MIVALISCLLLSPCATQVAPGAAPALVAEDPALAGKIAAAGTDVAKLLELAATCVAAKQESDAAKVYKRVLELDADNETARKGLRHQLYDGKWYESFAELSKFKREEAAKMKAKGLARFKEEWVPEADVPFLNMGWVRDANGAWAHPELIARDKQAAEWKAAGYEFRADDNSWIAPADFEHWRAPRWKCGEEWLDTAKANEFHAKLASNWELVGEHFEVWATIDWDGANLARWHADKIQPELVRLFGVAPTSKPHFVVLQNLAEYNLAASNGTLDEGEGFSSVHGAYFAEGVFGDSKPPQYLGCGVSYWDRKDPKLAVWGPYWVRWAAAQSFTDAIDRSWTTIGERVAGGGAADPAAFAAGFWKEKRIPRWLRYGAASYAERFLKNYEAAEGADPWTLRAFAFAEVKKAGGLRKLDDVFAFGLSLNDLPGSSRLYHEAGLLVSFLMDGAAGHKDVAAAHAAVKTALESGTSADVAASVTALQKVLAKNEREIKKYAGL